MFLFPFFTALRRNKQKIRCVVFCLCGVFQQDGNALAATNAGGANGILGLVGIELVRQVCKNACTAGSEGMTQSNGTTVLVRDVAAHIHGS
jgi:hypothetical protein